MKELLASGKRKVLPFVVVAIGIGLTLVFTGLGTKAESKWVRYGFSQSQTHLTLNLESSHEIKATQWAYAGPLDEEKDCRSDNKPNIPENLKGKADIKKSANNKKGSIKIPIDKAHNDKYYCLRAEGNIIYRLDYNPPVIKFEETNKLSVTDVYRGPRSKAGINSKSWRAAVFDVSRQGPSYGCDADNGELVFKPVIDKIDHVGNWSWGNTNYLAYYVPAGLIDFTIEFFDDFEAAVYEEAETDPTLIPFDGRQFSESFTDNIHLCHRVADINGNESYKLLRLDLGGPAIKLTLDGSTLRASSPAVDLDDSSWQYLATTNRYQRYTCGLVDRLPQPTGTANVISNIEADHWYCFSVLDESGNSNSKMFKINATEQELLPPPLVRNTNSSSNNRPPQAQEEPAPQANQPDGNDDVGQVNRTETDTGQPGTTSTGNANNQPPEPPAAETQTVAAQTPPAENEEPGVSPSQSSRAGEEQTGEQIAIVDGTGQQPAASESIIIEAESGLSTFLYIGIGVVATLVLGIISIAFISGPRPKKKW